MSYRLVVFPILVLIWLITGSTAAATAQADDPIPAIRRHYAIINENLSRYRTVKKELSGFSAEGGKMVAYLKGGTIMKIVATYYGETGRTQEQYYYSNAQLVFVLRREFTYDKPLSGKVARTRQHRFYFKADKLIKWIDDAGIDVPLDKTESGEKETEYLKSSIEFIEGSRSPKAIIEATN